MFVPVALFNQQQINGKLYSQLTGHSPLLSIPSSNISKISGFKIPSKLGANFNGIKRCNAVLGTNIQSSLFSENVPEVDEYKWLKKIGTGTFSDIHLVMNKKGEHYAIKMVKQSVYKTPTKLLFGCDANINYEKYKKYQDFLIAEGNKLLYLQNTFQFGHDQLIHLKEIVHSTKNINNLQSSYLVMELMGITLKQYCVILNSNNNLSLSTIRYISVQLLAAIHFLHERALFIHADLKPDNILLTLNDSTPSQIVNNKYPNIKIVDFGNTLPLSYIRKKNKMKSFKVQTLFYRAPEVLWNIEITPSIDLWSIGCILFELINKNQYNNNNFILSKRKACHPLTGTHISNMNGHGVSIKIMEIFGKFPEYIYNQFSCSNFNNHVNDIIKISKNKILQLTDIFHLNSNYNQLKEIRKIKIINRLEIDSDKLSQFSNDIQFNQLIDLIASLLDLNPSTRYSGYAALNHLFIKGINSKNIEENKKIYKILSNNKINLVNLLNNSNNNNNNNNNNYYGFMPKISSLCVLNFLNANIYTVETPSSLDGVTINKSPLRRNGMNILSVDYATRLPNPKQVLKKNNKLIVVGPQRCKKYDNSVRLEDFCANLAEHHIDIIPAPECLIGQTLYQTPQLSQAGINAIAVNLQMQNPLEMSRRPLEKNDLLLCCFNVSGNKRIQLCTALEKFKQQNLNKYK